MKKVLLVVMALALALPLMAATTGNGTVAATVAEVLTGQNFNQSFTFTVATNNMVAGGIAIKWPSGWTVPSLANITLAGNATEAKRARIETWNLNTYIIVTATANTAQTIIVNFLNTTATATAGNSDFVFYSADAKKGVYEMAAIGTSPSVYAWSSNKAVAVLTVGPSPVVAVSDVNPFIGQISWSVSPISGGQIRWRLVQGTPGYNSTPNPTTITSSTTTGKNNASWIVCTPGQVDTPVCSSNECYANIKADATISIGDKAQIFIGHPTPAVSVTPWHGTNYAKNMRVDIMANACQSAATETPVSYPTAAVSGNFTFLQPTPTVCLTMVANAGTYMFNTNEATLTDAHSLYSFGSAAKSYTGRFTPDKFGYYSVSAVIDFKDVNNDGVQRTNTTSAIALYNVPDYSGSKLPLMIANGEAYREWGTVGTVITTTPLLVTRYAQAQFVPIADVWGNSSASMILGNIAQTVTYTAWAVPNNGAAARANAPFVIPADTQVGISKTAGSDNAMWFDWFRIPLPTR